MYSYNFLVFGNLSIKQTLQQVNADNNTDIIPY